MELPADLAKMYGFIKDVAPWPDDDEDTRMRSGRAWVDLGVELRKGAGRIEPAVQRVWSANRGADVAAFKKMWDDEDGPKQHLAAGSDAALLTGAGTMAVVVLRVAWKAVVLFMLATLVVSAIAALVSGPVGYFMWASRLVGIRKALQSMLTQVRHHVLDVVKGTLRRAMATLSLLRIAAPVAFVGLPASGYWRHYGLAASDEEARRKTEEVLSETPAGREALAWVRDHGITVLFQGGDLNDSPDLVGLGDFQDNLDVLRIGVSGRSPEELAETFIHEVNHARNQGGPDPILMGREAFIDASIDEEVEGEVKASEMREQLAAARGQQVIETDYRWAYNDAVRQENDARTQAHQRPLTAEEQHSLGDRAGRAAVRENIIDADYRRTYGEHWDKRWPTAVRNLLTPP